MDEFAGEDGIAVPVQLHDAFQDDVDRERGGKRQKGKKPAREMEVNMATIAFEKPDTVDVVDWCAFNLALRKYILSWKSAEAVVSLAESITDYTRSSGTRAYVEVSKNSARAQDRGGWEPGDGSGMWAGFSPVGTGWGGWWCVCVGWGGAVISFLLLLPTAD